MPGGVNVFGNTPSEEKRQEATDEVSAGWSILYQNKTQHYCHTLVFSTNECTFYFRNFLFTTPYICFGRNSATIGGTLLSTLHCSLSIWRYHLTVIPFNANIHTENHEYIKFLQVVS
jgi:hypothetical protein